MTDFNEDKMKMKMKMKIMPKKARKFKLLSCF